jgi:hypothetical protein
LKVTIPGADPSHNFASWFVTAKGNTIPLEKEQGIIVAQVSQGIGSVGMDFGTFVYYHVDDPRQLREWLTGGLSGFSVPSDTPIALRVILINFDPNKGTIQLNSHSVLWMIFPTYNPQQLRSWWWYIVNVDGTGKIASTFSSMSLPYGVPTEVYFASYFDGGFSPSSISKQFSGPAAVNLMLFGTIGSPPSPFGQNIPFVSVYVS